MRISQKTEWILVAVLVAYIAFTPGFPVVREFLSTGFGKAVGLAAVVATWKYLSPLVAVLLAVNFVRCVSMREYADDASMKKPGEAPKDTYCPENYSFDNGQCKNNTTGQTIPATVCLSGQTWDGTKCAGSSTASTPAAPTETPPPTTSSTTTKQPFTNLTPGPVAGGVQPDMKEKFQTLAPAYV